MRRPSTTVIALVAGVFVLLLLAYVFSGGRGPNSDKLSDDQVAGGNAASDPEKSCGAQRTYDLIKRELFRRAAQVRGSDQAAFDSLSSYSVVRMDSPMLRSHDEDVGRVTCAGTLALDLPPGVAVVGGRRTLTANIGYAIQPSADGSGDVLTLTNAEGILTPLATLARVGSTTDQPQAPDTQSEPANADVPAAINEPFPGSAPPPAVAPPPAQTAPAPAPAPRVTASPSFNCRNARTRGEIAVCGDAGLASLDRQMAAHFNSAMSNATAGERAQLQRTRGRFLSYRDSCRSNSCIADAYRGRMREIQDILTGRWQGQ